MPSRRCDVGRWRDLVAGAAHTLGLRHDGRVLATADHSSGACDVDTWTEVGQDRRVRATEAITNLHTDDVERAREFFGFLGLTEVGMDQGWVARFVSPDSGACVQVVTRDATAPEDSVMTVKVDDVDAAFADARRRGYEIVHPVTDEPWGVRRFFVRSPDGHVVNVAQHR